jgi:hypothetical protein
MERRLHAVIGKDNYAYNGDCGVQFQVLPMPDNGRVVSASNNAANRVQGRGIRGPRNPVHVCAVLTHPHMHANCSL